MRNAECGVRNAEWMTDDRRPTTANGNGEVPHV